MGGELHRELQHVLAEQGHPRRAVRLLQVAAGGQRGAAVEDADVVEAEEAALEHVLAEAVLAVHPPGEVQQQLVERRLEEIEVHLAAQGLLGAMQEERRKGVDRRVHVAEVPLVGRHLAVGVQVGAAEHQVHLLLGEVGVDDRERQRVEGQVPGRVPGVLPLVGHRDDVLVQHVEPLRVPGSRDIRNAAGWSGARPASCRRRRRRTACSTACRRGPGASRWPRPGRPMAASPTGRTRRLHEAASAKTSSKALPNGWRFAVRRRLLESRRRITVVWPAPIVERVVRRDLGALPCRGSPPPACRAPRSR